MALKKTGKSSTSSENLLESIELRLKEIDGEIQKLSEERRVLIEDKLSLEISPFKIGGLAMCEISSGRTRKEQKCLLECESGTLYVRPIKDDGHYSGRHFSIIPVGKTKYSDLLKSVKE